MVRERVAAVIIENKKMLLVRDIKALFFSMPGGSKELDEDNEETLSRELKEELNVVLGENKHYFNFNLINQTYNLPQIDYVYLAKVNGVPKPSSEISELGWFSKEDIQDKTVEVPPAFFEKLFPKLIQDDLL
ncbi:MAG: NUDIX domain-containing protein [Candidatus Woesearchaeota archaeon]